MNRAFSIEQRTAHIRVRQILPIIIVLAICLSLAMVQTTYFASVTRAQDGSLVVTSSADTGDGICDSICTLREALNAVSGGETDITFSLSTPVTITLTTPLTLTTGFEANINIIGPGSDQLTIDGGNAHRVFFNNSSSILNVTISGMTIANGQADNGGGIYTERPLTLSDVRLIGNSATGNGGGLFNDSTVIMNNVIVMGNTAGGNGGGIFNAFNRALTATNLTLSGNRANSGGGIYMFDGSVGLTDSTVFDNTAIDVSGFDGLGGGIFIQGGESASGLITLTSSTVYSNSATSGGGIYNFGSKVDLTSSTVSGNRATGDGGGIANESQMVAVLEGAFTRLASSTITDNSAGGNGGGVANGDSTLENKNSIIAGNSNSSGTAPDCTSSGSPTFTTEYTLVSDDSGCDGVFTGTGNIVGTAASPVDAGLGRLSFSGGPTFVHALLTSGTGSPARDAGDPAGCTDFGGAPLATDQRGIIRERDSNADGTARCDIGAFEAGLGNDTWTRAVNLQLTGSPTEPTATTQEFLDRPGQSRWYKFSVLPGSTLQIKLKDLPANYDLAVYKDIDLLNQSLITPTNNADLTKLTAEFAPDAYSPDAYSPDAYSPDAYSPDAYSPDAYSPDAYSPDAYSPDAYSPDAYSPLFAYVSAQMRSLVGVSAFDGVADEVVTVDTWDNKDDYYVRVRGRNGTFNLEAQFDLEIQQFIGTCEGVNLTQVDSTLTAVNGSYRTLILTDLGRMDGSDPLTSTLGDRLDDFATRDEIDGVVVDVGIDAVIANANAQADTFTTCPAAKNLVANTIKAVISDYRAENPGLEYIVIVGNDDVMPFFRLPDRALLANEKNYVPPVDQNTTSYSNLILGYILSQDPYGSTVDLSLSNTTLPVPDMPVGRLVETPADIIAMLDAYAATVTAGTPGQVPTPQSALVTGYDFLEDAAQAVQAELEAGIGTTSDFLITPRDLSPLSDDPLVWSADDLRAKLLTTRNDIMFLAGHFSASSALAADYSTRLLTTEVVSSSVDLENALIFSAGCHSGYNIVNEHGIPNVTQEPDWAQAFAQKGATLIAGTGYQYGDTDFLEYSERIYLNFSQELLVGTGPVAIGDALVKAKQTYLAETAQLRGIHEKALLGVTLYGLPMLSIDMPFGRTVPETFPSIVGTTSLVTQNPGNSLGLQVADITIPFSLTPKTLTLESVTDNSTVVTTYISGTNGVVSNPAEPVLPFEIRNVTVPGTVLRGVGFRSGSYTDLPNITPLTGAATTEVRGVHAPFLSEVFFPVQPWRVNYFGALVDPVNGLTRLNITPAQFVSDGPTSTTGFLRQWDDMGFRFYYSNNVTTFAAGSIPATVAPPAFVKVEAASAKSNVDFLTTVVGDLSAGVQEVWVTYTVCDNSGCNGTWQALDLNRNADDSTVWEGTLALNGTSAGDIRYVVQAVNGVGLVSLNTNLGEYFTPDVDPGDLTSSDLVGAEPVTTTLMFQSPPASGAYNEEILFMAQLASEGTPLDNQVIKFALGSQLRSATTNSSGQATVSIPLLAEPGDTDVRVTFAGSTDYQASGASSAFTVLKQTTQIRLSPANAVVQAGATATMTATLSDATDTRLREQSVFFIVSGNGENYAVSEITNFVGNAQLGALSLPAGTYRVDVYFSGSIPLQSGAQLFTDVNYLPSSASGTLIIEESTNSVPEALDDGYTTDEDTTLMVTAPGVLDNDTDADLDTLSALLENGPSNGTLLLNVDGSFTYTPTVNFDGNDSFTYVVSDGVLTDTATVTVTVLPVNDAPVVALDMVTTEEDTPLTIDVLANDTDVDGDPLALDGVSEPLNGTVSITGTLLVYTPTLDFNGSDSFTYTASDGSIQVTGTVMVTVMPVNDAPLAIDDEVSTLSLQSVIIDVLANDSDVDGDPLTVLSINQPISGTAVLNLDQSVTYTSLSFFNGIDSFSYTISDGQGASAIGVVLITVESPPATVCSLYPIGLHWDTLADVTPGVLISDILNGDQPGNFGWLTWSGNPNVPTLIDNLTPPGNSDAYVNPNNFTDHVVSTGDFVQGRPGIANAKGVRDALDLLLNTDIVVPVWDTIEGQGNNTNYHIVDFAQVRLTDYQLPGQNRISARFVGTVTCTDEVQTSLRNDVAAVPIDTEASLLYLPLITHQDR